MSNTDLRCGDCLELMRALPDASVDAVITSPPYCNAREYSQYDSYADYLNILRAITRESYRVLRDARILVVNVSCVLKPRDSRNQESTRLAIPFHFVGIAEGEGFKFLDDILWEKPDGSAGRRGFTFAKWRKPTTYKPFPVTEYILVFKKGDTLLDIILDQHEDTVIEQSLVIGDYERTNIWKMNPETKNEHPAPFPIGLPERVISYYSFIGDTILDPFMGSGTTGVACVKLNRNFIGMEINPDYFAIAQKRIEEAQAQMVMDLR